MDRFIVSARKYRPQLFDSVVGQEHVTTTLKNAIRNQQLAHAFLFCGPRGVGKTTCARIMAKTINCQNPTKEGEACNQCSSCVSFRESGSINYFELDAASNNSVDDIRTLTEQVRFTPQGGRYKVYVIDEVHMLSTLAFNAFLKTLEEPPPYAIFILATTEKHKILPTILSRCQIFDFKRITTADTVAHLEGICKKEKIKAERPALQIIAQKSEGCMRDALSLLDKIVSFTNGSVDYTQTVEHLNILDEDYYFRFIHCLQTQDLAQALLLYDQINQKGFEGDLFINGMAEFARNLLVCQDAKTIALLDVVESFKDKYKETAKACSPPVLVSLLNILNEAALNYKAARNKRLFVELTLIKICYLEQALRITSGEPTLSKKKIVESPIGFRVSPILPYSPVSSTKSVAPAPVNPIITTSASAKLVIETPVEPIHSVPNEKKGQPGSPRLSALSKIREQFKQTGGPGSVEEKQLEESSLQKAWQLYTQQLKDAKNPAAQPFDSANLLIIDATSFEVITANNIEQRFIEQERNKLYAFLKERLANKNLQFSVITDEQKGAPLPSEGTLSSKERYQELIKRYPLIQELKERLKLDLDY
ncbi:MAG: DNA polymerase III subunit gamma/tau [Bacteroidetes bacterium]|nr:DNA polymerase III subunit gamma/tau [Bacteroidota bacterium]